MSRPRLYILIASAYWPFLKLALPVSRSLLICADRLGFTGDGGGGTDAVDSISLIKDRWRRFSMSSSVERLELDAKEVDTALVEGSIWRGRRVKVSGDSILCNRRSKSIALLDESGRATTFSLS